MRSQSLIEVNPNKMSGTPVFRGTRVPIQNLFDCIEEGETIDQFLTNSLPSLGNRSMESWSFPRKGYSKVKLLLDECVTRRLKHEFVSHEVMRVGKGQYHLR